MIVVYIVAIVIIGALIVGFFVWKAKKRNRKIEEGKIETLSKPIKVDIQADIANVEKEVVEEEKKIEAELEDFHFCEDEISEKSAKKTDNFSSGNNDPFDEELYQRKINSYDDFLNEDGDFNLDDELSESDRNDIDDLMEFDFDSLKGKSREEVEEMVKNFSPSVQEFILNDIFDKKYNED